MRIRFPAAGAAAFLLICAIAQGASAAASWCDATSQRAQPPPVVEDEWFEVRSVAPGVFAISEPRQIEGVNAFLIVGSARALLFDSGLGVASIRRVVGELTTLPVTVINSHTHFDHVGGNREFADVRNLDHPYSAASARGEAGEALAAYAATTLDEDSVCGALPAGVTSRVYAIPTWRIGGQVSDGELFDLGGRVVEVLRTPGHTPDSLCLLERASGLLFTGDTYYSGDIYLWAPETSVPDYAASIDKLVAIGAGAKLLLTAHGSPVAEPRRLVDLQQALRAIAAGTAKPDRTEEDRQFYRFEHFSILMSASAD